MGIFLSSGLRCAGRKQCREQLQCRKILRPLRFFGHCQLLIRLRSPTASSHSQGKAEQERQTQTVCDDAKRYGHFATLYSAPKKGKKEKETFLYPFRSPFLCPFLYSFLTHFCVLFMPPSNTCTWSPMLTDPSPCPLGFAAVPSTFVSKPTLIPLHCKQMIIISLVFQFGINWLIYTWINCINAMLVIGAWYDLK